MALVSHSAACRTNALLYGAKAAESVSGLFEGVLGVTDGYPLLFGPQEPGELVHRGADLPQAADGGAQHGIGKDDADLAGASRRI
jgi:hypothetical protein